MIFQKPLWKLFNLNDNSSVFETFGSDNRSSIELIPEGFFWQAFVSNDEPYQKSFPR